METLELPVLDELEDTASQVERDIDLAAFRLWREASRLNEADEELPTSQ